MRLTPWQRGLQPSNLRRRVGGGSLEQEREACRDAEVCGRRDQGVRVVAGSAALGTGSALLKKELVAGENWGELERLAKCFADKMAELKTRPGR